jgi:hypothetical protein
MAGWLATFFDTPLPPPGVSKEVDEKKEKSQKRTYKEGQSRSKLQNINKASIASEH